MDCSLDSSVEMMDKPSLNPVFVWVLDDVAPNREMEGWAEQGGVQVLVGVASTVLMFRWRRPLGVSQCLP